MVEKPVSPMDGLRVEECMGNSRLGTITRTTTTAVVVEFLFLETSALKIILSVCVGGADTSKP